MTLTKQTEQQAQALRGNLASAAGPPGSPSEELPFLRVSGLVRSFGPVKALDHVSFTLGRGCAVGLIGANGAGKTTAMRIITTQDLPDEGSVEVDGVDLLSYPEKVIARIGWMPDDFEAVPHTTIRDFIDYYARAYRLTGERRISEVNRVLEFCGLTELRSRRINRLSKGQRQRLCLARTLIGNPDLLVMDEPAAGLDPQARLEFKQMVQKLKAEGKTLLISSHILSELAEMCDEMIFMDAGRIIGSGSQQQLEMESGVASSAQTVVIELIEGAAALAADLAASPLWKSASTLPSLPGQARQCVRAVFVPESKERGAASATESAPGVPDAARAAAGEEDGASVTSPSVETLLAAELRRLVAIYPIVSFTPRRRTLEETFVNILHHRHEHS